MRIAVASDHAGAGRQVERRLDERLGLRTRDEHPAVEVQVEAAEPPTADDVLQRLARRAALEHEVEEPDAALGRRLVEADEEVVAGDALDDASGVDGRPQAVLGLAEQLPPGDPHESDAES